MTQEAIEKLTLEIKGLREVIKTNIQQKNEYYTIKMTTQKEIEIYWERVREMETEITYITEFVTEIEDTIEYTEVKIKEEIATKKVIETQKEAFKANQVLVSYEE